MEKDEGSPPEATSPMYPALPEGGHQTEPGFHIVPASGEEPVQAVSLQQPQAIIQVVGVQPVLTDVPGQIVCPTCQTTVITEVKHTNGLLTWLICAFCGLFLCWPCCWIPFCVKACKNVEHTCPSCKTTLHIYKRM